jgi:ketosteroid isomerase-like protein
MVDGRRGRSAATLRCIEEREAIADAEALLAANQAFYDAFEAADLDAMSEVWHHSDTVLCTHPGWATLQGWARVVASWYAIFQNPQRLQFILTDPAATVRGDVGWVSVTENLLDGPATSTVTAINLFERLDGSWMMVAHHASPVMRA